MAGAVVVTVATFLVTGGVANVPVAWGLGPCLKDWTSPSSYRPRVSPMETLDLTVGGRAVRVCYGRPAARGRVVFGTLVPYGALWRLGANEPTRLYTQDSLAIGGAALGPGRYSLYAIPERGQWTVFVNRSTFHWGNMLTERVRSAEVASFTVPVETAADEVERLTIRAEEGRGMIIEWERTVVRIPVSRIE